MLPSTITKKYGVELIMDLHGCNWAAINRISIQKFCDKLIKLIKMKKGESSDGPMGCIFWDESWLPPEDRTTVPYLNGISAVQFIETSSIVIHALYNLGAKQGGAAIYINLFSCKQFDHLKVVNFTKDWFKAAQINSHFFDRV